MSCVFKEAVERGWVVKPLLFEDGMCLGGDGCAQCCEETGTGIDPRRKGQVVAEALGSARNGNNSGIYLGVLNAVNIIEQQTGVKIT